MADTSVGLDESEMPDRPAPAAPNVDAPAAPAPGNRDLTRAATDRDRGHTAPPAHAGQHQAADQGPLDEADRLGPAQPRPPTERVGATADDAQPQRGRAQPPRDNAQAGHERDWVTARGGDGNGASPAEEAHDRLV